MCVGKARVEVVDWENVVDLVCGAGGILLLSMCYFNFLCMVKKMVVFLCFWSRVVLDI